MSAVLIVLNRDSFNLHVGTINRKYGFLCLLKAKSNFTAYIYTLYWLLQNEFKNCFNDVKEQSFMHMIHICCALSVKKIIRRVSSMLIHFWKVTVPYIQVYFRWKHFICLDMHWKLFLNKIKLHHLLRNFRTHWFFINVWNGNPTGNCRSFFFWHDQNLCIFFWSYTLCRGPKTSPFKTSKKYRR